jgi:hypothetical protein
MADPILTTVGSVASVVQLVDFGLRLTRDIYTFLWALKDSSQDIQTICALVDDTNSALETRKKYVEEHQLSKEATISLPSGLIDGICHLVKTLEGIRKMLPTHSDNEISFARRFKWVMDSRKLRDSFRLLQRHMTTLQVTLQIINQ